MLKGGGSVAFQPETRNSRVPAIAIGTPRATAVPIEVYMLKSNAASGCFAVPTLAAHEGLTREGTAFGLRPESAAKIETLRNGGIEPLSYMRDAGRPMGHGSDLLVQLQKYQTLGFELRAQVLPLLEIIASATSGGEGLPNGKRDRRSRVPGGYADQLVVEADPTREAALFQNDGQALRAIMCGGQFFKNELH